MKTENPFESAKEVGLPLRRAASGSARTRLGVLAFNAVLLGMLPPTCCPCGLGPIGFIVQPYMLLLGIPSIFLPMVIPALGTSNQSTFLVLYVANYVLLSYGLGVLVDRLRQRAH